MVETTRKIYPDYKVGYCRPPVEYQFKPGQRANPSGRPRGSQNMNTVVRRVLNKKVPVRRGDRTDKVSLFEAITETHALKAVQGDHRSTGVVISLAGKTGLLSLNSDRLTSTANDQVTPTAQRCPSDALVDSIDPSLLSKEEQIDLSRIAELIDRDGGDVIDLSTDDFGRFKQIVNKGRRKEVTPKDDASPETSE